MKPIPAHTLRLIASRDGKHLCHARQVVMKGGIEAGHLQKIGKPVMKCLSQEDFFRQMIGIERLKLVQLGNHFRCDALGLAVLRSAVYHAVSHRSQFAALDAFFDPIHQQTNCFCMVRRSY